MRTIEVKILKFNELSEDSKNKVIKEWQNDQNNFDYVFNEAEKPLDKYCDLFNVNYRNIDFLEPYRNQYKINIEETILSLSGPRLMAYLWNNYGKDIVKPKFIGSLKTNEYIKHNRIKSPLQPNKLGNRFNPYYSGCQFEYSCPLSGTWIDNLLLDCFFNVMTGKDLNSTFEDLINEGINNLCKGLQKEYEYQTSEQAIIEIIEANDYEFTEEGQLI